MARQWRLALGMVVALGGLSYPLHGLVGYRIEEK